MSLQTTDLFTLEACNIVAETDKAIAVRTEDMDEDVWIPISQVEKIVRNKKVEFASSVVMTRWIAGKKNLL